MNSPYIPLTNYSYTQTISLNSSIIYPNSFIIYPNSFIIISLNSFIIYLNFSIIISLNSFSYSCISLLLFISILSIYHTS